jgi:hypothetical protein
LDGALTQAIQSQFNLTVTGQHFYQSEKLPVFDLRSVGEFQGNPGAFVVAKKIKTVRSPDGDSNIPWLELAADSGQLASTIYRINTAAGQPAASVSSSVDWCLYCSINVILPLKSVTRAMRQVSSMPPDTVRLHDDFCMAAINLRRI